MGEATPLRVPASIPHNPISDRQKRIDGRGVYGLNWWVNGIKPDGKRKWPGAPVRTYAASGFNENKWFAIPEWGTVLVRMRTEGRPDNVDEVWSAFFAQVARALGSPSQARGAQSKGTSASPTRRRQ